MISARRCPGSRRRRRSCRTRTWAGTPRASRASSGSTRALRTIWWRWRRSYRYSYLWLSLSLSISCRSVPEVLCYLVHCLTMHPVVICPFHDICSEEKKSEENRCYLFYAFQKWFLCLSIFKQGRVKWLANTCSISHVFSKSINLILGHHRWRGRAAGEISRGERGAY